MKPLILFLSLAASPVLLGNDVSLCRKLSSVIYEGTGVEERYFRDASAAYRDCRGAGLPLDVRIAAYRKYAESHAMKNEPQGAIEIYKKAIELLDASATKTRREKLPMLIDTLDEVALLESRVQSTTDAIGHGSRALEARRELFGSDSGEASRGLTRLAILYIEQQDFKSAEPLLHEAIRVAEKACGPTCDPLADALSGMSVWYHDQGDLLNSKRYEDLSFAAIPESDFRSNGRKD